MVVDGYLEFLLEVITILIASLIFLAGVFALKSKSKLARSSGRLVISNLSKSFFDIKMQMLKALEDKKQIKALLKEFKKEKKGKKNKKEKTFVLKFKGDIQANAVQSLKKEVSAVLSVINKKDNVVLVLESPGGVVNGYGLAASELDRFRKRGINLTVLIDRAAASGGYMIACVADKIVASPFAIIGSIGVIAQVPNFNKLLKEKGVDFEQITSGEYKRTVTMFGENTDKDREKMQSDLDEIHLLFKEFVKERRTSLDIEKVSKGEYWLAAKAKELGLVDELMTSNDYLMHLYSTGRELFLVQYKQEQTFLNKLCNVSSNIKSILHYNA